MSKQDSDGIAQNFSALLAGVIFGAGLVVAGMTEPEIVLAFLTLNTQWNAALVFVLGAAVLVSTLGYRLVSWRQRPLYGVKFHAPASTIIDSRLLAGASLFGLGWGVSGFCPGPALVGAMTLDIRAAVFLIAYLSGVGLFELWQRKDKFHSAVVDG